MISRRLLVLLSTLGFLATFIAPASGFSTGIAILVSPIYAPDINNINDCSQTSIGVAKTDGTSFNQFDELSVRTREGGIVLQEVTKTSIMIMPEVWSGQLPKTVGLTLTACTRTLQKPFPSSLTVIVELKNRLDKLVETTVVVPLLPRNSEALAAENLLQACGFNAYKPLFEGNFVTVQTKKPKRFGGNAIIKGTFFRNGLIAANEEIFLHRSNRNLVPGLGLIGEQVASTTTDIQGQFLFNVPITQKGLTVFHLFAPPRYKPIGPVPGPFPAVHMTLITSWKYDKGKIWIGPYSWVPNFDESCKSAVKNFNDVNLSAGVKIFSDSSNPVAVYVKGRKTWGIKGAPTFPSFLAWDVKYSGKCYVRGYVTRTGKYVKPYWRRCG